MDGQELSVTQQLTVPERIAQIMGDRVWSADSLEKVLLSKASSGDKIEAHNLRAYLQAVFGATLMPAPAGSNGASPIDRSGNPLKVHKFTQTERGKYRVSTHEDIQREMGKLLGEQTEMMLDPRPAMDEITGKTPSAPRVTLATAPVFAAPPPIITHEFPFTLGALKLPPGVTPSPDPASVLQPPPFRLSWVWTTPEQAGLFLERNINNRRITPSKVKKKQADMQSGRWIHTGNPDVRFDTNNIMIDGQHSCIALQGIKHSMYLLVAYDLAPAAKKVVDTAIARNVNEILTMMGVPITSRYTAAIQLEHHDFNSTNSGSRGATKQEQIDTVLEGYDDDTIQAVKTVLAALEYAHAYTREMAAVLIRVIRNAKVTNSQPEVVGFLSATLTTATLERHYSVELSANLMHYIKQKHLQRNFKSEGNTMERCNKMLRRVQRDVYAYVAAFRTA